jgi:hypothetical protein
LVSRSEVTHTEANRMVSRQRPAAG